MSKKAVILVSGGLDSTTVVAMAKSQGYDCYTLSFDYGQRHRSELVAAQNVSELMTVHAHKVVKLDLGSIGGSALTDSSIEIPESKPQAYRSPMFRPATPYFCLSPRLGRSVRSQ